MPRATAHLSSLLTKRNRFQGDTRAQVSFSVVAVLLLTLAGASAILASQADREVDDAMVRRTSLEELSRYSSIVVPEVEELAYRSGLKACEELRSLNETHLEARFQELMHGELDKAFPCERGGMRVELLDDSLHLDFLRLSQGEQVVSAEDNGAVLWRLESSPAYFTIAGNFSISIKKGESELRVDREVTRHLYFPSPLLLDRLGTFDRSVTGGKNRLENLVRYELSSLAQWRALCGWGASAASGGKATSLLLTEDDARRALELALMIVEVECFGSFDQVSAVEVLEGFPCPMDASELASILQQMEPFDPADVFLALNGAIELDVKKVLAQALYASMDVIALRWLDYLRVIDLAEVTDGLAIGASVAMNDALATVTGEDNLQRASMDWIKGRLEGSDYSEEEYRWVNYASMDAMVLIPHRTYVFRDYEGKEVTEDLGGYQGLDFPSLDVLCQDCWKDFMVKFREGSFTSGKVIREFIGTIAEAIAEGWNIQSSGIVLDPFDDRTMMDEVKQAVLAALHSVDDWMPDCQARALEGLPQNDPLGQSLADFIGAEWQEAFHMAEAVDAAIDSLSGRLVREALTKNGIFEEGSAKGYAEIVSYDIKNDPAWGARDKVQDAFTSGLSESLMILKAVFSNITLPQSKVQFRDALVAFSQGAIDCVPGVRWAIMEGCSKMLEDASLASGLRVDRCWAIPTPDRVNLQLAGGRHVIEKLQPELRLPWGQDDGSLQIDIVSPLENDGSMGHANVHLTEPRNASFAAYQSSFKVLITGAVGVTLSCSGDLSRQITAASKVSVTSEMPIALGMSFTCSSAWPLQGVDYAPTFTLDGELGKTFMKLWCGLTSVLGWLTSTANAVFTLLQELVTDLISYAAQTIQALSEVLVAIVQEVQDLIDGAIGSLIGWMADALTELIGSRSIKLEFAGMRIIFDFSATDIFLGRSKEYVRVTVSTCLLGAQLTIQARFVDIYRQGPDVITNMSLSGEDWSAECLLDPRMMVMDHFVEMRGRFHDLVLELNMPEVVAYDKRTFRLSDVPGLGQALSRIPLPIPGLLASIDLGLEIRYDSPISNHVVINEVELNPPGSDPGREWVELYNPSNQAVDLIGWTLRTAHGDQTVSQIGDSTLQPKSHLVVMFLGQSLDNGGEAGYPLGESIALISSEGKKVDSAPYVSDHYNDARTWQRTFDGSDRWEFQDSTRDGPNALLAVDYNDIEQLERALADAVARAFAMLGDVELDLDSLAEMLQAAINEVVDTIIEVISRSIVDMSLFIEVGLQDYSESFTGTIRFSLLITGEGVRDVFLWVADMLRIALADLLNPTAVVPSAHSIGEVLDDVYLRLSVFGTAGLPKLLSSAVSAQRFNFGANVELNLAALLPSMEGVGNGTIGFGVLFEGVPGGLLRSMYPVDADQLVDVWLIRARLHQVQEEPPMSS
ncbi:MAG: lamin tail domain-containing protein [Methanomassiliicoccales archaeon]|nr:lamin tail domain-containing protein [Methanomassiliicoccales archaeon]